VRQQEGEHPAICVRHSKRRQQRSFRQTLHILWWGRKLLRRWLRLPLK
jgi:hypothetical protein